MSRFGQRTRLTQSAINTNQVSAWFGSPFVLPATYIPTIIADGALALWMLNDTTGTTANESVAARTSTYTNSPSLNQVGPGAVNIPRGVLFNGTNQYAVSSLYSQFVKAPSGSWSMEAWVKFTSTTFGQIMTWRDYSGIATGLTGTMEINRGTGTISCYTADSSGNGLTIQSPSAYNNGAWHHVVITAVSGGALTLYVDGSSVASTSTSRFSSTSSSEAVTIGANMNTGTTYFQYLTGTAAACAIYLTTLTQNQISNHYNLGQS